MKLLFDASQKIHRFFGRVNLLEIAWISLWLATHSFTQRTAAESLSAAFDFVHLQRYIFLALATLLLCLYLIRLPRFRSNPVTVFFFYALFALCSTVWSVAPISTLGKSAELVVACLIIIKTMSKDDAYDRLGRLFSWYLILYTLIVPASLFLSKVYPNLYNSELYFFIPFILRSDNSISETAAVLASVFLARHMMKPPRSGFSLAYIILFISYSLMSVYAHGRVAVTLLAISSVVILVIFRPRLTFLFILPALGLLAYVFSEYIIAYILRGQEIDAILELSGRKHLWELGLTQFLNHPFVGTGFGVGSRFVFLSYGTEGYQETISSIHNGLIEVLLGVGLGGLFFWLVAVSWGLWHLFRSVIRKRRPDSSILFLYFVLSTMSLSGVGGWMSNCIGLFLVTVGMHSLLDRKPRPGEQRIRDRSFGIPVLSVANTFRSQ